MQNLAQRELSILSEVPPRDLPNCRGMGVQSDNGREGVERREDGKVKEDEEGLGVRMWVDFGAFTHILPPQFFHSFICREPNSAQLTFASPCPGGDAILDVVSLLATIY